MADRLQIRRDTAANWTEANPILAQGEWGYELDFNRLKIGDGILPWVDLPYFAGGGSGYVMKDLFEYDSTPTFTLSETPSDIIAVDLRGQVLDGVSGLAWELDGDDITILYDLQAGDSIQVIYTVGSIGGSAVTTAQAQSIAASLVNAQKDQEGGIAANDTAILNLDTVDDFSTVQRKGRSRFYVNDPLRGGMFSFYESGYTPNGGTVFEVDGGYAVRNFTGQIETKWFGLAPDSTEDQTELVQHIIDSVPDGATISFEDKKTYRFANIPISKDLEINLNGSTVLQETENVVFDVYGEWSDPIPVSSLDMEVKSSIVVTTIYVSNTSGFYVDDIVKVFSEDLIPDNSRPNRKIGEFAIIAEIDENTSITFQAPLQDFSLYQTDVMVAKMVQRSFKLHNGKFMVDPDVEGSSDWNGGAGREAFIRCNSLYMPIIDNIEVQLSASNAIVFQSCFGYIASNIITRNLPDRPAAVKYGYGICDAQCIGGIVTNLQSINNRHGFTTNTYPVFTSSDNLYPSNFGRSENFKISNSSAYGGKHAGFDTHEGCRNGTFINCTHIGSGYRVQTGNSTVDGWGFQLRGSNLELIDCKAINCFGGVSIFSSEDPFGGDSENNYTRDIRVVNFISDTTGASVFADRAYRVDIIGGNYKRIPNDLRNDPIFKARNASMHIMGAKVKWETSLDGSNSNRTPVWQRNSDVVVDDLEIDISKMPFNNDDQLLNPNTVMFFISDGTEEIKKLWINNLRLITGRVSVFQLVRNITSAPNNNNQFVRVNGVSVIRNAGTIQDADSNTYEAGSLRSIATGVPISRLQWEKVVSYVEGETSKLPRNIVIEDKSTSSMDVPMRSIIDDELFFIFNPQSNLQLDSFRAGLFVGQKMSIYNASSTYSMRIPGTIANVRLPSNPTIITPKTSIRLYWDEEYWRLDNATRRLQVRETTSSTTLLTDDEVVAFTGSPGAARTLTLIDPALVGKKRIIVKDQTGFSSTHNITISGYNVDDQTSIVISNNYDFVEIYCNGTTYHKIS